MFRLRRAWLLFPLLVLTLFFVACGWRNWRLSLDVDSVVVVSGAYAASQLTDENVLVTRISSGTNFSETNFSEFAELMEQQIKQSRSGSKTHVFWAKPQHDCAYFYVEEVEVQNRFHATALVDFGDSYQEQSQFDEIRRALVLTRSPLVFWDDSWHISQVIEAPR